MGRYKSCTAFTQGVTAVSLPSVMLSCFLVVFPLSMIPQGGSSPPETAIRFYQKYISDLRHGRCRFDPSCSQYALDAVEERGLFVGAALAADRLVRCNRTAGYFYRAGPDGRLLDPVGSEGPAKSRPLVPLWLLPAITDAPPISLKETEDGDVPDHAAYDRILEYADFAETLAVEGDCWRAETEYARIAYIGRSRELRRWAQMKSGECLFRQEHWAEAADRFSAAAALSRGGDERNTACFMTAACGFDGGNFTKCGEILQRCRFEWMPDEALRRTHDLPPDTTRLEGRQRYRDSETLTMEMWLFLSGLCSMSLGDWDDAGRRFREITQAYPDSPNKQTAIFLEQKSGGGAALPRRNPALASVFSAILPGSGQVYAGRTYDGMRHLIFNGLLGYEVYRLAREENYPGVYLVTGIALPFYVGNVLGAGRSAGHFTRSKRLAYLTEVISATETYQPAAR
jgi:putative membrane protein insertion efficiency factor